MASHPKDLPDYEYECSAGHAIGADQPVKKCPAYFRGSPCSGALTRVGKGSRKNNGGTK